MGTRPDFERLSETPVPMYLCYKDFPREFFLFKLVGTTPEAFEKLSEDLARRPGVNASTTHVVRLDGKSRNEIEGLMRELGLITSDNEREVLLDISNLGIP